MALELISLNVINEYEGGFELTKDPPLNSYFHFSGSLFAVTSKAVQFPFFVNKGFYIRRHSDFIGPTSWMIVGAFLGGRINANFAPEGIPYS
jgi:phosphatidylserine decarboxylase